MQLQAQVSTLGWRIDDLLLTAEAKGGPRRLAISAKGNQQVSASGLPSDFVTQAWEQWRDPQGRLIARPMDWRWLHVGRSRRSKRPGTR